MNSLTFPASLLKTSGFVTSMLDPVLDSSADPLSLTTDAPILPAIRA